MTKGPTNGVIHHLHRAAKFLDFAGLTDGELLERYIRERDETAFAGLVQQHGPMVWGVCQRIPGHTADAEDAFQATFLVLVRKAASIAPRSRVGHWLYGVAHNTALKAKAMNSKRRVKESGHRKPESVGADTSDLSGFLDEELRRLPEKYRVPIVCCELEGRTIQEAARHLGWPQGTVAGRLSRGRAMLAKRFTQRCVTLSAGALGVALSAEVPGQLFASTIQAATAGVIPAKVAALTEGVIRAMFLAKLKTISAAVTGVAVLGTLGVFAPAAFSNGLPEPGGSPQKPIIRNVEKDSKKLEWKERLVIPVNRGNQVFSAAWSPKGDLIAVGSSEGAKLFDAATGKELFTSPQREIAFTTAFAPDGKSFASGHTKMAHVWDIATKKIVYSTQNGLGNISHVAFSPQGKQLMVGGCDGVVFYDVESRETKRWVTDQMVRNGFNQLVYAVAFSSDGKRLASADGPANTVTVWNMDKGNEWKTFAHKGMVTDVAYAPDGKSVAASSSDKLLIIWDLESDKTLTKIDWQTGGRHSLAYSPDGTVIAAAGGTNNAVKLFDATSGKELRILEHTGPVKSVSYSSDGMTLVTGGDDAVRVWEAKK